MVRITFFLLFFSGICAGLYSQAGITPEVIVNNSLNHYCYASPEVRMVYIPPPKQLMERKGSDNATIEVSYLGFPEPAREAFQYAVNIWASLVRSDVPIRIRALWTSMSEPDVLGSASATSYFLGSEIDAARSDVYYQAALAEKIAGRQLNSSDDFEISVRFNSAINWFFGLSGGTPSDRYDLVTVVLHELCHGLGFADSFNATSSAGSYGFDGIPVIYDTFVEDANGRKLTNQSIYPNPSANLRTALTSGALYFAAPVTLKYRMGSKPLLYAPGVFDSGSSISHLSESGTMQVDALMTPFIGKGEAIHDPGLLTLSILADLGWINTRIIHTPPGDTESNVTEVSLDVAIDSDTILSRNGMKLIYRYGISGAYDTISLDIAGNNGNASYSMPIPAYNTLVTYYYSAVDTFGRIYNLPPAGKNAPYSFFVGTDTVKPLIIHKQEPFILSLVDSFTIAGTVTDNLYPVDAKIEYRLNNGALSEIIMEETGSDLFSGYILPGDLNLTGVDTIFYRIVATDRAASPNTALSPASGFYKVPVISLFDPVEYYFTSFKSGGGDFLLDGFKVEQPLNFLNPALHSLHPYKSPETPDGKIEYQAILRYPVLIDQSGLFISFKEIVLVEPGEPGFPYGTEEFYDYVVVEASRDGGKSWFELADGYDSNANSLWLIAYNSAIIDNNSTAKGVPTMFIKRTISLDVPGIISENDILVLRFRLFSDPYANGWGWAVDDLFIKGLASSVETTDSQTRIIFPNPGNGLVRIQGDSGSGPISSITVSDPSGRIVKRLTVGGVPSVDLDLTSFNPGIYTIFIDSGTSRQAFRYILTGK